MIVEAFVLYFFLCSLFLFVFLISFCVPYFFVCYGNTFYVYLIRYLMHNCLHKITINKGKSFFIFHLLGPFGKVHLEASAFFGEGRKVPPYFQVLFYTIQARTEYAREFQGMYNYNPQVGFLNYEPIILYPVLLLMNWSLNSRQNFRHYGILYECSTRVYFCKLFGTYKAKAKLKWNISLRILMVLILLL